MDSLLILEPELLQRLKAELPAEMAGVHVLAAADLDGVAEEKQITPAVHLIYQGFRPLEHRADKKMVRIEQTWLTVVAVRNVRNTRSGAAARSDAGPLAGAVLLALLGWQPPSAAKPLTLSHAPPARFSAGHMYLPQAFSTELVLGKPRTSP